VQWAPGPSWTRAPTLRTCSELVRGVEWPLAHSLPGLCHHAVDVRRQDVAHDEPPDGVIHRAHLGFQVLLDPVQGGAPRRRQPAARDEPRAVVLAHTVAVEHLAGAMECTGDGAFAVRCTHEAVDFVQNLRLRTAEQS